MPAITSIMRYPIKGLAGQALDHVALAPGDAVAGDRAFAIRHGKTSFDPTAPVHLSKTKFLALMTHASLAALEVQFDESGTRLTLGHMGEIVFEGSLIDGNDITRLEAFMTSYMGEQAKGAPRLVRAEGHMFSDVPEKCLSVVNLASVKALGQAVGATLDPLRFRANIYLGGLEAWAERDWQAGTLFEAGGVRLRLMKHIVRCNATNVNLETAEIDQNLPKTLMKEFGANLMGVYFLVETAGEVRVLDQFTTV